MTSRTDLLVSATQRPAPYPGLLPEIHAEATRLAYVLRCAPEHPEASCRGRLLWRISLTHTPAGHPIFTLEHRNRRPHQRSGWHHHASSRATWTGFWQLCGLIRGHDQVLYQ